MEFIDLKTQYQALKGPISARIQRVLDHGQFIMGPEVRELEERLEAFTGARHCITCASGTEALLISLMALGIEPGDEVITTPFTFIATAEVIVLLGAIPVFVDIQPDTCNIDPERIEAAITPHTRAIIPVSLYGQPADMDEINAIATRHGLAVIEDAAQSFGADYRGRKSCNLSTIGCTSFFPSKPLGCYGDGGAVFTSEERLAQAMREIRIHGQTQRYQHTRVGIGGRMDTLQCAIALAKLDAFDEELSERHRIGLRYGEALAGLAPRLTPVAVRCDRTSVFAQMTVIAADREGLKTHLSARDIPTAVHYPLAIHQQPAYRRYAYDAFAVAERIARSVLSLPMHPYLRTEAQGEIVAAVRTWAETPASHA